MPNSDELGVYITSDDFRRAIFLGLNEYVRVTQSHSKATAKSSLNVTMTLPATSSIYSQNL
jgi:hypothetical protein